MTTSQVIAKAASNWLKPDSRWRTRAIAEAPMPTGFSPAMVNLAVDLTFTPVTVDALNQLAGKLAGTRRITHFLSGNVPAPGIGSICTGLLAGATNIVKCSSRDPVFPALFVESIREVDAAVASHVTVAQWSRADTGKSREAIAGADVVIAFGDDTSIAGIRALTPSTVKFFGHGHKISIGIVGESCATEAAFDVSVYDQQGCMSPHAFFVEGDGHAFAGQLAVAMTDFDRRVPRGRLSIEEAAAVFRLREACEFRGATVWSGPSWTVIYDARPEFVPSCLNRTVFVKPLATLPALQAWAGKISTVGIAPINQSLRKMADKLADRVCAIGEMQRPKFGSTA